MIDSKIKISFIGGRQVGAIALSACFDCGVELVSSVAYSQECKTILQDKQIDLFDSINDAGFISSMDSVDLLLSVHSKEIVGNDILSLPDLAAVNVHPYLYKYKGADPVGRAISDGESNASVGAHHMTEIVDAGPVIVEEFIELESVDNYESVYEELYPLYYSVVKKVLDQYGKQNK